MICRKCGKETPDALSYCMNCGVSKEEMSQTETQLEDISDILPDLGEPEQKTSVKTSSDKEKKEKKPKKPKGKNFKTAIIAVCSVVIIGGGGFGIYKLTNSIGINSNTGSKMFYDGLMLYKENDRWGYINQKGETVINPQFDIAFGFSEDLAVVGQKTDDIIKYGYIDKKGEYVIWPQFDDADHFDSGIALVEYNNYIGVIDKKGNYVINPQYKRGEFRYLGNKMFMVKEGDYCILKNEKQKPLSDIRFQKDEAIGWTDSFFNKVLQNDGYDTDLKPLSMLNKTMCYINSKGEKEFNAQFDDAMYFSEGLASVKINGKIGYIDRKGKTVINPQFEEASQFKEGLAVIKMSDKYGYIDKEGKYVINPQYESASAFDNGVSIISDGEHEGLLNKEGNIILNYSMDELQFGYDSKMILAKKDDKYGYINHEGNTVLPCEYIGATNFSSDGYAIVLDNTGKAILINQDGNQIWERSFDGLSNGFGQLYLMAIDIKKEASINAKYAYNALAEYLADQEVRGRSVEEVFESDDFLSAKSTNGLDLSTEPTNKGDKIIYSVMREKVSTGKVYVGFRKEDGTFKFFSQYKNDQFVGQYPTPFNDSATIVFGQYTD